MGMKRPFIISHKRKLAFVHVSKAGSTTIAKMIISEEYPPANELHNRYVWKYNKELGSVICSEGDMGYHALCFVRNPFTRVRASFYHFLRTSRRRKLNGHLLLNDFIKRQLRLLLNDRHFQPMRHFLGVAPSTVEILRFENFSKEMTRLFDGNVCHENNKSPTETQDEYNSDSISIISDLYKWDIEHFGYSFEETAPSLN